MATLYPDDFPFCLERLETRVKKLNGSQITASESRRLLVDMVGCFVVVGRQVGHIQRNIKLRHPVIIKEKDSDFMRTGLMWFAENVLPTLISTGIIGAILWIAAVSGRISVNP